MKQQPEQLVGQKKGARYCEDKRDIIVDVALDCFLERGYDGTTVEEIAKRASSAKATVYTRFGSKDEMYAAAVRLGFQQDIEALFSPPAPGRAARASLTQFGQALLAVVSSSRGKELCRLVVSAASSHPDSAKSCWALYTNLAVPSLVSLFEELKQRNELVVPNPARAAIMFMNMVCAETVMSGLFCPGESAERISAEDVVADAVDMMLRAYGVGP